MTPPDTSPAAPVDTSAEAVAARITLLREIAHQAHHALEAGEEREDCCILPIDACRALCDALDAYDGGGATHEALEEIDEAATLAAVVKERDAFEFAAKHNAVASLTASRQLAKARAVLKRFVDAEDEGLEDDDLNRFSIKARALLSGETTI